MQYEFAYDWFSPHIPVFQRSLEHLVGKPCAALEIGTHEGRSATWLLDNVLTHPDARLICVDLFEQPNLASNLAATGAAGKAQVRIGYSHDILRGLPCNEYDFIYVDGSHWACDVLEDSVMAFRAVKVGGIIGFDDYLWDDPMFNQHGTPKIAIDAFLQCSAHKVEVLEHAYQVWVRKLSD